MMAAITKARKWKALEGDSRIPKKAADKKFQIQNNLASVLHPELTIAS